VNGPPREKPLLGGKALRKLTMELAYHALDFVQAPVGSVFWLIEQRKARLQDQIENERNGQ